MRTDVIDLGGNADVAGGIAGAAQRFGGEDLGAEPFPAGRVIGPLVLAEPARIDAVAMPGRAVRRRPGR